MHSAKMVGDKLLMLVFIFVFTSSIAFGAVIEDGDGQAPNGDWFLGTDDPDEDAGEEMDDLRSHSQFGNFLEDDDDSESKEQMVNIPTQDRMMDDQVDNDDDDDVMNEEEEDDNFQDDADLYSNEIYSPSISKDAGRTSYELDQSNSFQDFKAKVDEIRKTNEDMQEQINRLHTEFDSVLGHSEDLPEHAEETKNYVPQDLSGLDHSDDYVSNENKENSQDTGMHQRSEHEDELARWHSQIGEDDYASDNDY